MKIKAFIDWEDCAFMDFAWLMKPGKQSPSREFIPLVYREYERIWNEHHKA